MQARVFRAGSPYPPSLWATIPSAGMETCPTYGGWQKIYVLFGQPHFFRLGLLIVQDQSFNQHNNHDRDEGANQGPRDVGPLDDADSYWDGAEESQVMVRSLGKGSLF
jgi:hypothetical protein